MSSIEKALRNDGRTEGASADAARRFSTRAAAEGLVDVAYGTVDSPFGALLVASTPRGLVRVAFEPESSEAVLDDLASRISPRVMEAPQRLDAIRRELDEYFEGERHTFELRLDWRLSRGFAERVLRATARIPYGSVSTYKTMATAAGNERASRAAGNALGSNPIPIVVPCHRVIATGGGLGGYGGGLDMKEALLRLEGALL